TERDARDVPRRLRDRAAYRRVGPGRLCAQFVGRDLERAGDAVELPRERGERPIAPGADAIDDRLHTAAERAVARRLRPHDAPQRTSVTGFNDSHGSSSSPGAPRKAREHENHENRLKLLVRYVISCVSWPCRASQSNLQHDLIERILHDSLRL